jgi:conjugal transfer pilus assembly protein TraW
MRTQPKTLPLIAILLSALSIGGVAVAAQPSAKTKVTVGPVYDIAEPSIYEQLQELLKQKKESGELAQIEREGRERAERTMRNPAPVEGLRIARTKKSWTYDPSVVATADVRDNDGNLIVARGTAVSPLDQVSWKPMVFFDQRDESQVRMAKKLMAQWNGRGKAVLVAGNWIDISRAWGHQVYFDQKGTLIQKFGINAVPATVTQQGKVLLITELPVTDEVGGK